MPESWWNEYECLLLNDFNRSHSLDLRYDLFPDFYFDDLEVDECLSKFRFHKRDSPSLTESKLLISKC